MKKLFMLSAALILALTLCIGIFAAEKTVYIASSGDDAKDGSSYKDAIKTIGRAYEIIGTNDGKIVVCNYLSVGSDYVFPEHSGNITITASDGKMYFPLGTIAFSKSINISGDTTFERIKLSTSGIGYFAGGGNDLTLGNGIETIGSIDLIGGYYVQGTDAADANITDDYTITVKSGSYTHFRGGNRRATGSAAFGTISGNCTINISGGEFTARDGETNLCAATGMNHHTGSVTVNVSGGEIYGSLFAVGRAGTNNVGVTPVVSGNVTVNVSGGIIGGRSISEVQDPTTSFTGKYSLNLTGGNYPRIESVKGSDTATLTMSESVKNIGTSVVDAQYTNPLRPGPDPWVIQHDGMYYVVISGDGVIYCYAAPSLEAIRYSETYVLWRAPKNITEENKMYSKEIWSPELHYVSAEEFGDEHEGWWLYFSADDGSNPNHRLYCVKALTDDPLGAYGHPVTKEEGIPQKMTVDGDREWAIGQSLIRINGSTYLTWTSETDRGVVKIHKQDIRIAKLENPYTIIGEGVKICVPEYDWEKQGAAYNETTGNCTPETVEGATAVYGDNGEIIIIYSASNYTSSHYCLATLTLKEGADPLNKDSWVKSPQPIFSYQNGVFGPGHAAYTTDAEGNRFMIYHAYLSWRKVSRHIFIQPYTVDGTTVTMNGGPYATDTVMTFKTIRPSVTAAVQGFGK